MDHLDFASSTYNYYPRTMITLCVISYQAISTIAAAVGAQTDQVVVWGPAELRSSWDVPYCLAYIVKRQSTEEYTVVIRGTNMLSWESWTQQDFAIAPPLPSFRDLAPHAPVDAYVSQGTMNGMTDLLSLRDPTTGQGITSYLQATGPRHLYVTGHSLGGTLTPPLFAYLNDVLNAGRWVSGMALWSFAGLTAGDVGFSRYFNSLFNPLFPWRLHNTLDIAPFCWWSLDNIKAIYQAHGLNWGFPEDDLLEDLFKKAAGQGYTQPAGDQVLAGVFDPSIVDRYLWTAQAMHQHHATTYQALVDLQYPLG